MAFQRMIDFDPPFDLHIPWKPGLVLEINRIDVGCSRGERHHHAAKISPLSKLHEKLLGLFRPVAVQDVLQRLVPLLQFLRLDSVKGSINVCKIVQLFHLHLFSG